MHLFCSWYNQSGLPSKDFICGHCGSNVASNYGYRSEYSSDIERLYICHKCKGPNLFYMEDGIEHWIPGQPMGNPVKNLPKDVENLYEEIRNCAKNNCFTASVLLSRKLLMNIAVEEGADEGLRFIQYIDYLQSNNYTPPKSGAWIDKIRTIGNEATHEIAQKTEEDARLLIKFSEMLLRFIYEFPQDIMSE